MIYVKLTLALLVLTLAGAGLAALLLRRSSPRGLLEFLGLSYALGFGLVGLASVVLMLAGIRIGPWLAISLGILGMVLLIACRPRFAPGAPVARLARAGQAFTVLVVLGMIFGALHRESIGWDAEIFWSLKGRSIQRYGSFRNPDFLSPEQIHVNIQYPLLVPSIYAWVYDATGSTNGRPIRLTMTLLFVASLAVLGAALRRRLPADLSVWLTALYALTPMFDRVGGGVVGGYADYPLGVFILIAALSALAWLETGDRGAMVLSACAIAYASQIKSEGGAFTVVCALVFPLFGARIRGWRGALEGASIVAAGLILFGLWTQARRSFPPGAGSTSFAIGVEFKSPSEGLPSRVPFVLREFATELSGTARWQLFWPALFVILVLRFPRPKHPLSFLAWTGLGQLGVYLVVWALHYNPEFKYWNAHRMLLHLYPTLFAWGAMVLGTIPAMQDPHRPG